MHTEREGSSLTALQNWAGPRRSRRPKSSFMIWIASSVSGFVEASLSPGKNGRKPCGNWDAYSSGYHITNAIPTNHLVWDKAHALRPNSNGGLAKYPLIGAPTLLSSAAIPLRGAMGKATCSLPKLSEWSSCGLFISIQGICTVSAQHQHFFPILVGLSFSPDSLGELCPFIFWVWVDSSISRADLKCYANTAP